MSITTNQIQIRPRPNIQERRKKYVNFFITDETGFRFITLFDKNMGKQIAEKKKNAPKQPYSKNVPSTKKSTNTKQVTTVGQKKDLYHANSKGKKYSNG
jgi:hypothetical protein